MKNKFYDICAITTLHKEYDNRIYYRQLKILENLDLKCSVIAPWENFYSKNIDLIKIKASTSKLWRIQNLIRIFRKAIKVQTRLIIIHDPDFLPMAYLLKKIFNKIIIYDCHENLTEDIKYGKEYIPKYLRGFLSFCFNLIENTCVKNLFGVICVVPYQFQKFKSINRNILLYRNFCSLKPRLNNEKNYKKIIYTGSVTKNYGGEKLLELAKELKRQNEQLKLTIVDYFSNMNFRSYFINKIKSDKLNIDVIPAVKCEYMEDVLNDFGFGLSIIEDTVNKRLAYPTKIFEYIRFNIIPVASNVGYSNNILLNGKIGILFNANNIKDLVERIKNLSRDVEMRNIYLNRLKKVDNRIYNWDKEKMKFTNYITMCLKK